MELEVLIYGLNGRDLHLPRTVNELRVDNNHVQLIEIRRSKVLLKVM